MTLILAEGRGPEGDVLVELGVEPQDRPGAGRAVVAEDRLALPEPPHEPGEVLHLGGGDVRHAVGVIERLDAAADAEGEPPAGRSEVRRLGTGCVRTGRTRWDE